MVTIHLCIVLHSGALAPLRKTVAQTEDLDMAKEGDF